MKKRKGMWIITFLGIFLMLLCIIPGEALVEECTRLNGTNSMQKALLSLKNRVDPQSYSLTLNDIRRLKKELSPNVISCAAQSGLAGVFVSNGKNSFPVRLAGVDFKYQLFNGITMLKGSFITEKQEEEGELVAVIDEELSKELFKTVDSTGKTIELFGFVFRITGVASKDTSIIGKLTDDGLPDIYVPVTVLLELDTTSYIPMLQVGTGDTGTLDLNKSKISNALSVTGKNSSNYFISDFNLNYALMRQIPLIYIFILGLISILILLAHIKKLVTSLYLLIRVGCRADYLSSVIKTNMMIIGVRSMEIVLLLTGILLLALAIRFRLYIPPKYIPDELINISYYVDLIKGMVQGGIQNMGYIRTRPELIVNTTNALLNLSFLTSVLGLPLFFSGLWRLRASEAGLDVSILIIGLFFVLSIGIQASITKVADLPFMLSTKGILVVWAFIFINIMMKRKESDFKNV